MKYIEYEFSPIPHNDYFARQEARFKFFKYVYETAKKTLCPYGYELIENVNIGGESYYKKGDIVCSIKSTGIITYLECIYDSLNIKKIKKCPWLENIPKKTLDQLIKKLRP